MNPVRMDPYTRAMRGPEGSDVQTLYIQDIPDLDPDIGNWQVSAWKPTVAELQRLVEGKHIFLYIQGTQHPIVGLQVEP